MYTIEQLREVIKAELDKQEYVEEPYSLFEPIKYICLLYTSDAADD